MLTVFLVVVARGQDADAILSEEVQKETGAQVLTMEAARARGFTVTGADDGGLELRVVAVPERERRFVQARLEASAAVASFTVHEVAR
jgi:hypothetical protein